MPMKGEEGSQWPGDEILIEHNKVRKMLTHVHEISSLPLTISQAGLL
jgi:hypothetical protein